MKKQQRLQQKIDSLNKQWKVLHEKLSRLEQAKIVENDVTQQIKLDSQISETKQECDNIEQQIEALEEQITQYPDSVYKLIFINADTNDVHLCDNICQLINDMGIAEFIKLKTDWKKPSEIREAFEAWIIDCDALVVIYGKADFGWLNQIFKNVRKVVWRRAHQPLPAYVLCEPSPEQKQLIEFSFRGISTLQYARYTDALQFREFINSL